MASGITRDNYADRASTFMALHAKNGKLGVMLERYADQAKWAAWLAYFRDKTIRCKFMERAKTYMVPAEWPHLFDIDASIARDHSAGYERREPELTPAERREVVRRVTSKPYRGPNVIDQRVYDASKAYTEHVIKPHALVKPEGYWTNPNFDRAAWDTRHPVRTEGNEFPRDRRRARTPDSHLDPKEKHEPRSAAELRTPSTPASDELLKTLPKGDDDELQF